MTYFNHNYCFNGGDRVFFLRMATKGAKRAKREGGGKSGGGDKKQKHRIVWYF